MKRYAEREIDKLDFAGGFYSAHINAMTSEGLNSKSAIAAELAFRDFTIAQMQEYIMRLENKIDELLKHNEELSENIYELTEERDTLYMELAGHESF